MAEIPFKVQHLQHLRHTIYHVHAPVKLEDGRSMYLPCLEAMVAMVLGRSFVELFFSETKKIEVGGSLVGTRGRY